MKNNIWLISTQKLKMIFSIYLSIIFYCVTGCAKTQIIVFPHEGQNTSENIQIRSELKICEFEVDNSSRNYFDTRLKLLNPNFIKFKIEFVNVTLKNEGNKRVQPRMFKPQLWFWTYRPVEGHFPYLGLNVDSGLLSFDLLNSRSKEVDYVMIKVKHDIASCVM